ncbi:hypothetical protein A3K74_01860 [Candidatus Pacearchaeota archaeon RBG_13_33_26]|nr:MAG: hypothetical protein A3K74_01860 [Candidatus Pacearchaeota archaeon RBG_13_33_26]
MIIINLILSLVFLVILIKCADYSMLYSSRLAKNLHLSEFVVSFFIIAIISTLPEATISIISAFNGEPQLGLGTLLGAKIADLTLVLGIAVLFSSGGIKVKSKILQNNFLYLFLLLFPLILGFDGEFSRIDGIILVLVGISFFIKIIIDRKKFRKKFNNIKRGSFLKNSVLLTLSLAALLIGAFFAVKFATNFAYEAKVPEILIGITILALGTCLPELFFSIKAARSNRDELVLGDLLGTVITDATIILGIVALICPFTYNPINIYVLGGGIFLAGIFTIWFMKTNRSINKFEGLFLILLYILFIFISFFINNVIV